MATGGGIVLRSIGCGSIQTTPRFVMNQSFPSGPASAVLMPVSCWVSPGSPSSRLKRSKCGCVPPIDQGAFEIGGVEAQDAALCLNPRLAVRFDDAGDE